MSKTDKQKKEIEKWEKKGYCAKPEHFGYGAIRCAKCLKPVAPIKGRVIFK